MIALARCFLIALCTAPPSGQIAFVSGADPDDLRVCVVDVVSHVVTPIGPGTRDGAPVWSPDGAWLAFETERPGGRAIRIASADGSNSRTINHASEYNRSPRWAPDGRMIAYVSGTGENARIAVYDLQADQEGFWGGGRKGLLRPVWITASGILRGIRTLENAGDLLYLDWQSDANLIAIGLVTSSGALSTDVFVVTPQNAVSIPAQFLPSEGHYTEWAAEPSPDGGIIAFESNDGGDREIFVLREKGAYDVTNHRAADWNPVWSPDGKWFAFESFRGGRRGVYRAFPDTMRVIPVAAAPDADFWHPTWSPDGAWLAFVSNGAGRPRIFIAEAAGGNLQQLTNHEGAHYAPAWRPVKEPRP